MKITLNGEPFDVAGPLTVADLLLRLEIDARRVAVERNLVVLKRALYDTTEINEADQIEIVNFVGGGAPAAMPSRAAYALRATAPKGVSLPAGARQGTRRAKAGGEASA